MLKELDIKGFGPFEVKDADKGEVTAVVATLGVVDRDGDVILPGAIPANSKVKLSGYGHDVVLQNAPPVGVGTINEVGDKAIFSGRFFLATERGREAFATVKELGQDGEWSFGFPKQVKTGELTDAWKSQGAKRIIKALLPVEASPVFIGAGRGTGTLNIKAAESLSDRMEAVHNALWARNDALGENADAEARWYAHEIFEDHVIVRGGAKMFKVLYTIAEDGTITLGESVEVEVVYQPIEEPADAKAAREEAESKAVADAQAKQLAEDMTAKANADAADLFDRIQRNLRKFAA